MLSHTLTVTTSFTLTNQGLENPTRVTYTALTSLADQWLSNINNNQFRGVLIVDFAKAFDVIDHDLFLRKLALYGLSPATITFLPSFLTNRVNRACECSCIQRTVSQIWGSARFRPWPTIPFSIYIDDLPLFIKACCDLFADDTTIHTSNSDPNKVSESFQKSVNRLIEWTELNHMFLHNS